MYIYLLFPKLHATFQNCRDPGWLLLLPSIGQPIFVYVLFASTSLFSGMSAYDRRGVQVKELYIGAFSLPIRLFDHCAVMPNNQGSQDGMIQKSLTLAFCSVYSQV
jgi:hypothetical protein